MKDSELEMIEALGKKLNQEVPGQAVDLSVEHLTIGDANDVWVMFVEWMGDQNPYEVNRVGFDPKTGITESSEAIAGGWEFYRKMRFKLMDLLMDFAIPPQFE